jgi:recombination protein RecR
VSVIDEVTREFTRLPGIGPRTARRLVHHLLRGSPDDARRLSRAVESLVDRVRPCEICGAFAEGVQCEICSDVERDRSVICVVEGAFDVHSIDDTGEYRGLYHVLGGQLSPLDGIGPDELRIEGLLARVEAPDGRISEAILATSPSVEGEATAVYLEQALRSRGVRVTRLARGLPMGSDLEYVDGSTLAEALAGRREM